MMNIYVGNLAAGTTEQELREAFESFGEVDSAKIIKDNFTGKSRGFGFVVMPSQEQAQAAIEGLNGKELEGSALTVNEAKPRESRGGRPGGGGPGWRSTIGRWTTWGRRWWFWRRQRPTRRPGWRWRARRRRRPALILI